MKATVFFDIGDTLVHRPSVGPGKRLAERLGLPRATGKAITQLVFRATCTSPAVLAVRLQAALAIEGDVAPVLREIWEAQEHEPVEVPGATTCVEAVAATGARVGVISNIWAPYAAGFRRACPAIVPHVAAWHLSYEHGLVKPDPALFRAALAAGDVRPEHAVMVGDSLDKDVVPAAALGMGAIWVPGGDTTEGEAASAPLPPGAVRARDLAAVQALLVAALAGPEPPRVRLSAPPVRAIGSP